MLAPLLIPVLLLWLAGTALRLTILSTPPVIPDIHEDLALSATGVGILAGLPVVMFALVALPGSLLIARLGAVRALLAGLLLCAAGSALRGASPNALALYFTTAIMSAGVAIMQPALPPLVRQWMPAHVGFGTAVFTNGLLVGEVIPVALTLPLVMPLVGDSWRLSFVAWALPMLAIALVILWLRPRQEPAASAQRPRWWPDWKNSLIWKLGVTFGTVNAMYFAANGFIPDYLNTIARADLISAALTALNLGQIPASILMLIFASRLQGRAWPFAAFGTVAILSLIGIVYTDGWWIVAASALLGFCCAGTLVLSLALPPLLCPPQDVARISAAMFTVSYGFAIVVPVLSGIAWDLSGAPRFAFLPIALCAALLVALTPTYKFHPYKA